MCSCACESRSIFLYPLYLLRKESLAESGDLLIGWTCWPEVPRSLPLSSPAPGLGLQMCSAMQAFLHGCWESELRSLCLNTKHFTQWAIPYPLVVHSLLLSRVLQFIQFTDIWQSYRRGEGEHRSGRQEENSCVQMTIKNENQQAQRIQNAHFKRTSMGKVSHGWERLSGKRTWGVEWGIDLQTLALPGMKTMGLGSKLQWCLRTGRWDWALVPGRLLFGSFCHLITIWLRVHFILYTWGCGAKISILSAWYISLTF